MSPEALVALVSSALSVALEYLPKIREWYDKKTEQAKRNWMLVLLAVGSVAVIVLPCYDFISVNLPCTITGVSDGLVAVVLLFVQAIAVNQGVHRLTKRRRDNAPTG